MEKLLEVENLSVSYFTYAGEVQSVRGISFDLPGKRAYRVYGKRVEYLPWKRMLDGFPGCTGILKSDDEGWKADCRKSEESRE